MRGAENVTFVDSGDPNKVRVLLNPWSSDDQDSEKIGCCPLRPFTPSIEDGAYRIENWSNKVGSLKRAQLMVGLAFHVTELRGVCFEGRDPVSKKEIVDIVLNADDCRDKTILHQICDGLRQGLMVEDVPYPI